MKTGRGLGKGAGKGVSLAGGGGLPLAGGGAGTDVMFAVGVREAGGFFLGDGEGKVTAGGVDFDRDEGLCIGACF